MTKLSQSYLELRRALSLGSKSSSLVVLISREPLAFKVTFISTVTRFKVTDIYHGRDRSPWDRRSRDNLSHQLSFRSTVDYVQQQIVEIREAPYHTIIAIRYCRLRKLLARVLDLATKRTRTVAAKDIWWLDGLLRMAISTIFSAFSLGWRLHHKSRREVVSFLESVDLGNRIMNDSYSSACVTLISLVEEHPSRWRTNALIEYFLH